MTVWSQPKVWVFAPVVAGALQSKKPIDARPYLWLQVGEQVGFPSPSVERSERSPENPNRPWCLDIWRKRLLSFSYTLQVGSWVLLVGFVL